jgi:hypothetical protein
MRTGSVKAVRALLRAHADGLTAIYIADTLGRDRNNTRTLLHDMPDTYIDRWIRGGQSQLTAVWCVVVPPPHCPKPPNLGRRKKNGDDTRSRRQGKG